MDGTQGQVCQARVGGRAPHRHTAAQAAPPIRARQEPELGLWVVLSASTPRPRTRKPKWTSSLRSSRTRSLRSWGCPLPAATPALTFVRCCYVLEASDFPDDLGREFEELRQLSTKAGPAGTEGLLAHTLRTLPEEELTDLVERFWELFVALCAPLSHQGTK